MITEPFIKGITTDKYEKEYGIYVSPKLEEKLISLISKKYDLDESIEIESFAFLGQVIVVCNNDGWRYIIPYSEL